MPAGEFRGNPGLSGSLRDGRLHKVTYPDFIIIRKDPELITSWIFEPHNPDFKDNLEKQKACIVCK